MKAHFLERYLDQQIRSASPQASGDLIARPYLFLSSPE